MVRLYMDENVRGALTRALRARGVDVLTVQEDGIDGAPDPVVLDRATQRERVLFSQDDDLLREAAARQRRGMAFSGVVYAHQSVSLRQCVGDLELLSLAAEPQEFQDRVRYLPLR